MKIRWAVLCLVVAAALGCRLPVRNNLPPAEMLMHPGPGVDGPGPGVMTLASPGPVCAPASSQVAFLAPEGAMVFWEAYAPGHFDSEALIVPGRYNFPQGAIYRLKLTNITNKPGVELYPTLEVAPPTPRTDAYLAHNAIPIQFTNEDLEQVLTGNFVTKVIYLPDPEFQDLAVAGVETLVSTRLDPGLDPIVEADRRGAILAIVRIGNKDLEVPGVEAHGGEEIVQASYNGDGVTPVAYGGDCPTCYTGGGGSYAGCPDGSCAPIAGVNSPAWGMPMSGTPIGLPGPPHVPLGGPAGLRRHVMRNHTFTWIPRPTRRQVVDVLQTPGMSYPRPANHAFVHERARGGGMGINVPPVGNRHVRIQGASPADCPPH